MKRISRCIAAIAILGGAAFCLEAESLDKTVATIRLAKTTEVIFLSQLKKQIETTETALNNGQALPTDQRKNIFDGMITKTLFLQAAERDKVTVPPETLKVYLDSYKTQLLRSGGVVREVGDAEWQMIVQTNTGQPYEEWLKQFKNSVLIQYYTMQKRGAEINAIPAPTDAEVQEYYDANKSQYLRHDMVTISHIFVNTTNLTKAEDRDKALKRAEDIAQKIRSGASTFKDLVVNSDDTANKYKEGKVGWVDRENAQTKQVLGKDIYDAIFKMKPGDISGVLTSPTGFHIIRLDEKAEAKILGLEDPYPTPDSKTTVREYTRAALLNQKQQAAVSSAMKELGDALRKEAESLGGLTIEEKNLPWQ